MITFLVAAMAAMPLAQPAGIDVAALSTADEELASATLASGEIEAAARKLEEALRDAPEDPALLINLGIAKANTGEMDAARDLFTRALTSDEPIELETAEGKSTDSRRLAREALSMLDRGAFRPK